MVDMSPSQAWDRYVGSQSVAEFVDIGGDKGITEIDAMCSAYAEELPNTFTDWSYRSEDDPSIHEIADLLARYIRQVMPEA